MVCPHPETIEIAWVLRDRLELKDPDGKGGPPRGRRPFVG
jgi:dihydropyrimidinase